MMKFAAVLAGLAMVNAAEVPSFSNDDYDEMNLNIRLLASHNVTSFGAAEPVTADAEGIIAVTVETTISATGATTETLKTASKDKVCAAVEETRTILDEGFCSTIGSHCANCNTISVTAARRQRKRALQSEDFLWSEGALISEANKAAFETTLATASFTSDIVAAITAAAATAGVTGMTVDGVSAPTLTVVTTAAPTTQAPAAAAATTAAAAASSASLLKANVALVAIAAAIFA